MKKLFFLTALLLSMNAFAQNQFASVKKVPKILTLSNGRYAEVFANDTLRRIGSVIFNTVTNKVEYFIPQEDEACIKELERSKEVSRFLSVDPLTKSFPELTPYQYASNNPIENIDLDGKEGTPATPGSNGFIDAQSASYVQPPIPMQVVTAPTVITATEANASYAEPAYTPGSQVKEFKTSAGDQFVRVYTEGKTLPNKSFMMKKEDIEGLTPAEIKDKFSLKYEPTHQVDVNPPEGTTTRTGEAAKNKFGSGGGTQYELRETIPDESYTNPVKLPANTPVVDPTPVKVETVPAEQPVVEPVLDEPIIEPIAP